jgi:hypothetical protein
MSTKGLKERKKKKERESLIMAYIKPKPVA